MGKFSFVLGAGVGYLLGTRAGRAQFEKIKKAGSDVWRSPQVQSSVHKVEDRVGEVARKQGGAMTDRVAGMVKDRINQATASSGAGNSGESELSDGMTGSAGGPDAPMEPTPPKPDLEQR